MDRPLKYGVGPLALIGEGLRERKPEFRALQHIEHPDLIRLGREARRFSAARATRTVARPLAPAARPMAAAIRAAVEARSDRPAAPVALLERAIGGFDDAATTLDARSGGCVT